MARPPYRQEGEKGDMRLNPIKKTRFYQEVINQIKSSVEAGELRPGDKLPSERQLAAALSISRTAVREAISALESAGIVEIRPGVGIFLTDGSSDEILLGINGILNRRSVYLVELLELRQGVESQAAYLAASRATEQQKHRMREVCRDLERVVLQGEVGSEEDFRFHLSIVDASANQMLRQVIELVSGRFKDSLEESRKESLSIPGQSQRIFLEHEEILQAIEAGKAEEARDSMWRHLENVRIRYL